MRVSGPLGILLSLTLSLPAFAADGPAAPWRLPIQTKTLANGLNVIVSEDHTSPTIGISVVYGVGMRLEPKGRTGFAHLFEHLMFQGTPNAPKGVFDKTVSGGGGVNNGSTRPDFTDYIETAPVSALEPLLWLEADRMKGLDFSAANLQNQKDVVKEEIRVNVKNQPYGAVAWLDIAQAAFQKWENSHDGYGSFEDLEGASLDDVRQFHATFYRPNNAVLAIAGDVTVEQGFALAEKYFGAIPKGAPPPRADVSEPLGTAEKRLEQSDPLAQVPALVAAWRMPARGSTDHAPMAVLGQYLGSGKASAFYQGLIKGRELAINANTSFGLTGPFEFAGPTLFTAFILYKPTTNADVVLGAIDEEIAKVAANGIDAATLARTKTQMIAAWNNNLEGFINRANVLARMQTMWGDANVVNKVPDWINSVSSDDIKRVAGTYLTRANRVVIDRKPAPKPPSAPQASAPAQPTPSK